MPLATMFGRLLSRRSLRSHSTLRKIRSSRLGFEVCEQRCTPAILLNVGTHDLLPDTPDQRVDIFLESTDPANDPEIELMNLKAEIGDAPHLGGAGFDPYPNFQSVDYSGGIWDEFPTDPLDQTGQSSPYHAEGWVLFTSSTASVVPDGKIVTLIIDTTGFESGEFPLKFENVGAQFGGANQHTDFRYTEFDSQSETNQVVEADVDITNGTIRIAAVGQAPVVDLNGAGQGTSFEANFTEDDSPEPVFGTNGSQAATLTDPDSLTLASLTITLSDEQDAANEILAADTSGTLITADYDANSHTLELSGTDTIENYQQVLRSVTYENTTTGLTPGYRTLSVVASDGTSPDNPAATSSLTAYDLSYPWHNEPDPTNVNDNESGTTLTDALLIVSDLRSDGIRQLPPTAPAGSINYVDVDRNNRVTLSDALVIVSRLRDELQSGGEGENFVPEENMAGKNNRPLEPSAIVISEAELEPKTSDNAHDLALLAALQDDL